MIPTNLNFDPDNSEMNEDLFFHLKRIGLAFPETQEEVNHFLELLKKQDIHFPKDLPSASEILNAGLIRLKGSIDLSDDVQIEENLAQAAREGGDISEDIMRRMAEDRQKSEEQEQTDDDPR